MDTTGEWTLILWCVFLITLQLQGWVLCFSSGDVFICNQHKKKKLKVLIKWHDRKQLTGWITIIQYLLNRSVMQMVCSFLAHLLLFIYWYSQILYSYCHHGMSPKAEQKLQILIMLNPVWLEQTSRLFCPGMPFLHSQPCCRERYTLVGVETPQFRQVSAGHRVVVHSLMKLKFQGKLLKGLRGCFLS